MKDINVLLDYLDELYPDARCELVYHKDYELLIATVLSAQCTDKRVNQITEILWKKYDIFSLAHADISEVEEIIRPLGSFTKKLVILYKLLNVLLKTIMAKFLMIVFIWKVCQEWDEKLVTWFYLIFLMFQLLQ